MSDSGNIVQWKKDGGTIVLKKDGAEERLILLRRGFWDAFFTELVKVLGEDGVSVTFRNLVTRLGGTPPDDDKLMFKTWIKQIDERILPVDKEKSTINETVIWKNSDREITVFGDTIWILQDVLSINAFKEATSEVLTEKGANAIIRNVCRKGGLAIGDQAVKNYKWKDMESAMQTQDEFVFQNTFSMAGWSLAESKYQVGPDGDYMIMAKCKNTFESEGVSAKAPVCKIMQNYMEGAYEGIFSILGGKSVEVREVMCRATGDDYCALAFKFKDKAAGMLDWYALEDEWRALI